MQKKDFIKEPYMPDFCRRGHEFTPENTRIKATSTTKSGLQRVCIACNRQKQKEWKDKNRDKVLAEKKAYYQAHKEDCIARVKNWQAKHPDYWKQYYQEHKEAARDRSLAYYHRKRGLAGTKG